jgi:hypothetical protein
LMLPIAVDLPTNVPGMPQVFAKDHHQGYSERIGDLAHPPGFDPRAVGGGSNSSHKIDAIRSFWKHFAAQSITTTIAGGLSNCSLG